jgi:hypothetical protein
LIKEKNEEKVKTSFKCPFSLKNDKKSSLTQIICKGCGKIFNNNNNSIYCLECEEIFYDEP